MDRKASTGGTDRAALQAKLAAIKAEQEAVEREKRLLQEKTATLRKSLAQKDTPADSRSALHTSGPVITTLPSTQTPSSTPAPSPAPVRGLSGSTPSAPRASTSAMSDLDRQLEEEKKKLDDMIQRSPMPVASPMRAPEVPVAPVVAREEEKGEEAMSEDHRALEELLRAAEVEAIEKDRERQRVAKEEEQELQARAAREAAARAAAEEANAKERERQQRAEEEEQKQRQEKAAAEATAEAAASASANTTVTEADSDSGESYESESGSEEDKESNGREALQVPLSEMQEALKAMAFEVANRGDSALVRLCSVVTRKAVQMVAIGSDADFASSVQMLIVDLNKQIMALLRSGYEPTCLADTEDVIGATLRVLSSGLMAQ